MKRILGMIIAVLCFFQPCVSALDMPEEIWGPFDEYQQATADGNDAELVRLGEYIIGVMEGQPRTQENLEFIANRFENITRAAERIGMYDKAVELHKRYLPYAQELGWQDGYLYSKKKIYLLQSFLNVYVQDRQAQPPYYGAKFEPERGIYFGAAYDNDTRIGDYDWEKIQPYFPKKNSVYLIYLEFGDELDVLPRYERYFNFARQQGIAVELAWNTYAPIYDLEQKKPYIQKTIDDLAKSGLKIFLRFGNEMNIGSNGDDPQAYVNAFRFVAEYAKTKDNIAMVWSPNDLGALDRTFEQYYPGDEYVDWIGASHYIIKYFEGRKDHGSQTDPLNTYFSTGEFANPILRMRELTDFMKEYGIEKPIMISEGGVPHFIRPENEDSTEWAMEQLRKMYTELLLYYPQIKMIEYFNVQIPNETNAYELYTNSAMNALYNELVDSDYFLSSTEDRAPFGYRQTEGGVVYRNQALSLAAYYPKADHISVKYYLDGAFLKESTAVPYPLSLADIPAGQHQLKIEFCSGGSPVMEKTMDLDVQDPIAVIVDGLEVEFQGQEPVLSQDRTLVPARGVFEAMKMQVSWDDAAQKATVRGRGKEIELTIGSREMLVNGKAVQLDVPPMIMNDRTMLPLRAVAEAAEAEVNWNEAAHAVLISTEAIE